MREEQILTRRELAQLRKKFPLPEGVPDAELNQSQVALFMGVSAVTVSNWLNQGMPVEKRGGNGKEYKFRAADVWAWRKGREADELAQTEAAQRTIQAMRLQLIGGAIGSSIDGLRPKEKREIIETQMAHEQFQLARNELLKREDVADAFEMIFGLVRDSLDSLPDQIHREAALTNKQIGLASEICDRTLAELEARITRFFADRPRRKGEDRQQLFDMN